MKTRSKKKSKKNVEKYTKEVYNKSMIKRVELNRKALKELDKLPDHIARVLQKWVSDVESLGLHQAQKIPAYHDHALRGEWEGHRAIRLNYQYRAIYFVKSGTIETVVIERLTKHDYRKKG